MHFSEQFIACLSSYGLQAVILAQNEVIGQRSGADEHFRPAQQVIRGGDVFFPYIVRHGVRSSQVDGLITGSTKHPWKGAIAFREGAAGSVAQALRLAQVEMLEDPVETGWSHPFYWAGFSLVGDGAQSLTGMQVARRID